MAINALPGTGTRRRVIPSTPNPLDKSTIVSIFPKAIREVKHTLQPQVFEIPAGTFENPALLVVGTARFWIDRGDETPILEVPVNSIVLAESIIRDYSNGLIGCNMNDSMPGLFFLPGEISLVDLKAKHKNLLEAARAKQKTWYEELVKLADIDWARTNGNPLSVSGISKLAAEELGYKNKPWMGDIVQAELSNCPACGYMRNSNYPVCPNCKNVIDVEAAKKLGLKFAS